VRGSLLAPSAPVASTLGGASTNEACVARADLLARPRSAGSVDSRCLPYCSAILRVLPEGGFNRWGIPPGLGVAVAVVLPEAVPPPAAASSTPVMVMALPLLEGRREDRPSPPPETPREDVEDWRSVESASSQGDMSIRTIVETLASFGT
jgi:hypothetical protein